MKEQVDDKKGVDEPKMVKRIFSAWRDFSKDPMLATRAMVDIVSMKMLSPFNPEYKRYERDLEELKKVHPDVHNLAIGTAAFFAAVFSLLCAVVYLMMIVI